MSDRRQWWVYIVCCRDGTLYTGITNHLSARIAAHNAGKGARYTRARRPVSLVWKRRTSGKPDALRLEYRIKGLSRLEKLELVVAGRAGRRFSSG